MFVDKTWFYTKRRLTNAQALEGVGESKEFSINVIKRRCPIKYKLERSPIISKLKSCRIKSKLKRCPVKSKLKRFPIFCSKASH